MRYLLVYLPLLFCLIGLTFLCQSSFADDSFYNGWSAPNFNYSFPSTTSSQLNSDFVMAFRSNSWLMAPQFLDRCYANGIKVALDLQHLIFNQPDSTTVYNNVRDYVQEFQNHPAVAGWYTLDEPLYKPVDVSKAVAAYNAIKTYDPLQRPVYMTFHEGEVNLNLPSDYAMSYDVMTFDYYPARADTPEWNLIESWKIHSKNAASLAQTLDKDFVNILQGVGYVGGAFEHYRLTTYAEDRFMTYYSIVELGAKSIWHWNEMHLLQSEARPSEVFPGGGNEWIAQVGGPIGADLQTVSKALGAGALGEVISDSADVIGKVYLDPATSKFYLLTVNKTGSSKSQVVFTLDDNITQFYGGQNLTTGETFQVQDNQFQSPAYTGYDVQTYELFAKESSVHYIFNEVSPGQWEVLVEVTGDTTAGLSSYSVWVDGVDPATVSYDENGLWTVVGPNYTRVGFQPETLVTGDVGGSFNASNYQGSGESALQGVGKEEVYEEGAFPGYTPLVDLDVPALLGILTTEPGLGEANFRATNVGLLNINGDGFLSYLPTPTYEVNSLPWLLGDANCDGVVSAADYASVQANFGSSGLAGILGDANKDGVVSAADYASVQANFGNSVTTATPEPNIMLILSIGTIAIVHQKKRS